MKKVKLLARLATALLCGSVTLNSYAGNSSNNNMNTDSVVKAINKMNTNIGNWLHGDQKTSIVSELNNLFVSTNGKDPNSSLDKKIDYYATQFYPSYTNMTQFQSFLGNWSINTNASDNNNDNNNNNNNKNKPPVSSVSQLLRQEIYYDLKRGVKNILKDFISLLLLKTEGGINDISANVTTKIEGAGTIGNLAKGGSPYGSLMDGAATFNVNGDAKNLTLDIMDVEALLGPDSYNNTTESNTAKLYIRQLMQSAPPPKVFDLYQENPKTEDSTLTIYLPGDNSGGNALYTKAVIPTENYKSLLKIIESDQTYLKYKMKVRSMLAIRTLYLRSLFNAYNNRNKGPNNKSIVEIENEMATTGLRPEYYNNLANQSVANVNLEMLHTMNKVVYFLNQLHKDNERLEIIQSIAGIQAGLIMATTDDSTVQSITKMVCNNSGTQCSQP